MVSHGEEASTEALLERVADPGALWRAFLLVRRNRGSPGEDAMTVDEFPAFWERNGASICAKLLSETYRPSPVRRRAIAKPGGGERLLGIPNVLDRVIQQSILLVLQPLIDPSFSESSYGFRPGRSAHDAVRAVQGFVAEGYDWVVDLDLERFFDRVNHDVLMHRVSLRVKDKRLLRLIRRYLEAGVMVDGVCVRTEEGTPQGGPLSPLLANVLLDDLDRELARRGHKFARYADDCNIYVRSEAAGQRVFASVTRFLEEELRLRVNRAKSAVDRPWNRKFLSFTFVQTPNGLRVDVAEGAIRRFRDWVRAKTSRTRGDRLLRVIEDVNAHARSWFPYFRISECASTFRDLDGWVRRRLRCLKWVQWKTAQARERNLRRLGVGQNEAAKTSSTGKGAWRLAGARAVQRALGNAFFRDAGLFSLLDAWHAARPR